MLKACEDKWPEFMDCVEQIRLKIKLEPLNGMLCKLASEVTSELDEEYVHNCTSTVIIIYVYM